MRGNPIIQAVTAALLLGGAGLGALVVGPTAPATAREVTTAAARIPRPSIGGFTATPSVVSTADGAVTFTATISNATSCTLSSLDSVPGLPVTTPCGGAYSQTVVFPQNSGTKPVKHKIILTAVGTVASKSKRRRVTIDPGAGQPFPTGITATYVGPDDGDFLTNGNLTFTGVRDSNHPCSSDPSVGVCSYVWTNASGSWFSPDICGTNQGQEVTADPSTVTDGGTIELDSQFLTGSSVTMAAQVWNVGTCGPAHNSQAFDASLPSWEPLPLGATQSQYPSTGGGVFTFHWTY